MSTSVDGLADAIAALSPEEFDKFRWATGNLDHLVRPYQREVWKRLNEMVGRISSTDPIVLRAKKLRRLVLNFSRRWGKTTLVFILLMCLCLALENKTYYFVAPTADDARDIVAQISNVILSKCPDGIDIDTTADKFHFPATNSNIKIGGTWNGARSLRGRDADGVVVDEAAFIPQNGPASCLNYVLGSVIQALTLDKRGWVIITSTPPTNMKHDYVDVYKDAEKHGILMVNDIYTNTSLSEEEIEEEHQKSLRNDPTGSAWKREYLAMLVPASQDLIIPIDVSTKLTPLTWERPENFEYIQRYIVLDHGTTDLTAVLFGYYDFANAKRVVESGLLVPKQLATDKIAEMVLKHKFKLWDQLPVFRCVADSISHQLIIDMNGMLSNYGITFVHPSKTDLEAMVNQTIITLNNDEWAIAEDTGLLWDTIRSGTWKVSAATGKREFARLNEIGHCDFLAALIYLQRSMLTSINPYNSMQIKQNEMRNPFNTINNNTEHSGLARALAGPQRALTKGM